MSQSIHPPDSAPDSKLDPKSGPALDIDRVRGDFPALEQTVHGRPLVYLDNAATALKPRPVIDAVTGIYTRDCGNVARGVHQLSQRATGRVRARSPKNRRVPGCPRRR